MATIIDEDRQVTLEKIEGEANLSTLNVQRIMKDLLQKKIYASGRFCQTVDQCAQHVAIARQLLHQDEEEGETFLKCIVAMDVVWVRDSELKLKLQSTEWKGKDLPRTDSVTSKQK